MWVQAAELEWLVKRCVAGPIHELKQTLENLLKNVTTEEVKMPLNVACSDVLRGILTRIGDRAIVAGQAHFLHHKFDIENACVLLPQISLLKTALERILVELATLMPDSDAYTVLDRAQSVQAVLTLARKQLASPERALRFPERFFTLGVSAPAWYCGEMFACEEHKLVFNLHAYQDRGQTYVATDSVSVKGPDPQLQELWRTVDGTIMPALQQVVDQLQAVLMAGE